MAEEPIWKGTSSQWKNAKAYVLVVIALGVGGWLHWGSQQVGWWVFLPAAVLAVWALWRLIVIKSTTYSLTTERLITTHGILTKVTDTLELYRVRDMQVVQPLMLRMLGLQNIHVITTDSTTAELIIDYIPAKEELGDRLRKSVEDCRLAKRVRSMDVVSETPGDHPGDHPGDNPLT
jgi:membrane protein YdbS with pleckstrin-like domain